MDEIEESKSMLKEIHEFFKANIKNGTFINEGFNDGFSKQYNFMDFSLVLSLNEKTSKAEEYNYYSGDRNFATVYPDNSSNLDNEFIDEVEKVIELHDDFRKNLKIHNQSKQNINTRKIKY
jgi:hypothetical protein